MPPHLFQKKETVTKNLITHFDEDSEVMNRYRDRRKAVHLPVGWRACALASLDSKLAVR